MKKNYFHFGVILCGLIFQIQQGASQLIGTWRYRHSVDITGASLLRSGSSVVITFDTFTPIALSQMRSDGADIRFSTDLNGTSLCAWLLPISSIDGAINTATTKILIKVPIIPATGTRIYLWYGNPTATYPSSYTSSFTSLQVSTSTTLAPTGSWINYDRVIISAGATLNISQTNTTALQVEAAIISIDGKIEGSEKGPFGLAPASGIFTGMDGYGPGAGLRGVFGGGGGGAYGGKGGDGAFSNPGDTKGAGGSIYGTSNGVDIQPGSSGGGTEGVDRPGNQDVFPLAGGNAGAAISLRGSIISIGSSGAINMNGGNGAVSIISGTNYWTGTSIGDSGGGSGGGVMLVGHVVAHNGAIRCNGGFGGNSPFTDASGNWQDGGGGGGGGRVKIFYANSITNNGQIQVLGGTSGRQGNSTDGVTGTVNIAQSSVDLPFPIVNSTQECLPAFCTTIGSCGTNLDAGCGTQINCPCVTTGSTPLTTASGSIATTGIDVTTSVASPTTGVSITSGGIGGSTTGVGAATTEGTSGSGNEQSSSVDNRIAGLGWPVLGGIIGGGVGFLILLILVIVLGVRIRRNKSQPTALPRSNYDSIELNLVGRESTHYSSIKDSISPYDNGSISRGTDKISAKIKEKFKHDIQFAELDLTDSIVVGSGAFGLVYSAKWRGRQVAVKQIKKETLSENNIEDFIEEAEIMKNMKPHPNVVLFIGLISSPFCIVTEFMEGGNLWSYISKKENKLEWQLKKKLMTDIATGMMHLSIENLIHRDLATRNVLLTKTMDAKVSDFGLSRLGDASNAIYSVSDVGPLKWMAPEAIKKKKFSTKSDVWAFAVTCCEVLNRDVPYPDLDPVQAASAVVYENLRPKIPPETPPALQTILKKCFETEPENRPSFEEIVNDLSKLN